MSILSDQQLLEMGPQLIQPFSPSMVQPASIDVHVDRYFYEAVTGRWATVADPSQDGENCFSKMIEVEEGKCFVMGPGLFVLASTFERVTVPPNMVARFEGKSSLARLGLLTHVTAGFIDPGFDGHVTLELKNLMPMQFVITPGMKIGQICFEEMERAARYPYGCAHNGSHYNHAERGPTLSRSYQKFKKINVY